MAACVFLFMDIMSTIIPRNENEYYSQVLRDNAKENYYVILLSTIFFFQIVIIPFSLFFFFFSKIYLSLKYLTKFMLQRIGAY